MEEVNLMRPVVLASALILVTACDWTSALAQGSPSRETPVGQRQPKAGNVPQEQQQQISDPNKKIKELDDALAKKLNGICRGC
jgi:TolA-binding protein